MHIIIVGAGKIGYFLAKRLYEDKHTVVLVEKNKTICEQIAKDINILVIHGDGCDMNVLNDAGAERCDVVAAVTGEDEDNLIISQLAKEKFNVSRTVARVNDSKNEKIFSELGVDVPVDATSIIAQIIEEEVSFSDLVTLMSFKRGKLSIVRVDLPKDSPIINKKIQEISLPADSVLVTIIRGDEVIVPKGNTILKAMDDIVALTLIENEKKLLNMFIGKNV
ncbi:MAG: NAD-binding protein [Candidatus Gygaella obscura]|nr:NAD-binding protein [Candidatus Gygaella obscura]